MNFYTSDTHFGHARIAAYCGRPWPDVAEMNEQLIARWNAVVAPDDTVWHFGDVAMGLITESLSAIPRLNGTKILVPGNHDRCWSGDKRAARFRARYEDAGFTLAEEQIDLTLADGTPVRGCHFPYLGDSHDGDRFDNHRPVDDGRVLIHGHVHDKWRTARSPVGTLMVNVGVDAPGWEYTPVSESTLIALISQESIDTGLGEHPEQPLQ